MAPSGAADPSPSCPPGCVVGVCGTLCKHVTHFDRANNGLEQVGSAGPEHGHVLLERRYQFSVDGTALLDAENIHTHHTVEERSMCFDGSIRIRELVAQKVWDSGIGRRELVICCLEESRIIPHSGAEVGPV